MAEKRELEVIKQYSLTIEFKNGTQVHIDTDVSEDLIDFLRRYYILEG